MLLILNINRNHCLDFGGSELRHLFKTEAMIDFLCSLHTLLFLQHFLNAAICISILSVLVRKNS